MVVNSSNNASSYSESPKVEQGASVTPDAIKSSTSSDPMVSKVQVARMMGYEGDACPECSAFTLVRNGTCLKCDSCGATTGCSYSRRGSILDRDNSFNISSDTSAGAFIIKSCAC